MSNTNWTDDEVKLLKTLCEQGASLKRKSMLLGRSVSSVATAASVRGFTSQKRRPPLAVSKMLQMYRRGDRMMDIVAELGVSKTTISTWLNELQEPRRPIGRPKND